MYISILAMYTTTSKCLPLYLHTTTIPTAHNALHELRPRRLVQSRNWRSDDSRVQKEMACENSSTNCSSIVVCYAAGRVCQTG